MKITILGETYEDIDGFEFGGIHDQWEDPDNYSPYQFLYLYPSDGGEQIEIDCMTPADSASLHVEYDSNWQLVRFECNWADEIEVDEIGVMTGEEFTNYVTRIKQSKFYPVSVSIGSNQQIEFNKAEDVYFNSVPVSEEFALAFKTLCPYGGSLKTFYRIAEYLQDKELYP